jgi:DNA (cytosine-5)-methyltransferase 1
MDTTSKLTHISLCYGYGGIDLGLNLATGGRVRTVAICEIEAACIENALAKMEQGRIEAAPIWTDLKTFPWASFRGKVDILSGGYPCQPFSAAGKRLGTDDPRHLWPYIADGVRILRPAILFFENVEGHISLGLSTVVSDLEGLGYTVSWGIFSAAEVGAPHQRKRVFIVAQNLGERGKELIRKITMESQQHPPGYGSIWPARPGQPQYEWEEPKVV